MKARALRPLALLLLALGGSAHAHDYRAQLRVEKFAEVERAANVRLAADPTQADALIGKAMALMAMGSERIEEAVKLSEQCVAAHPANSECHEALGATLGTKAMNDGIMSAMGYASKIRDAFKKAVELDPNNLSARFSLLQFYIQAPRMVGGGISRAQDLAVETGRLNTEAGRLMLVQLDLHDDRLARAESVLLSINPGASEVLADQQRGMLANLAFKAIEDKKLADAERLLRELHKRFPDSEWGPYGLARLLQEQGKHQAALPMLEKAATLAPQPRARNYYRMGQSYQAMNDKAKAITAYEKALALKPALGKKQKEDAQDQLKSLKS